MTQAERTAQAVASQFGRNPAAIAEAIGLPIFRVSLPAGQQELYIEEHRDGGVCALALEESLNEQQARELLAHGLAHHLLHAGDRLTESSRAIWSGRHEREADDFAACLLIPEDVLEREAETYDPPGPSELAEYFGVSEALVLRRVRISHATRRSLA